MTRSRIVFLLIVLLVLGIVGSSFLLRSLPPLEVEIAACPQLKPWLTEAAAAFNDSQHLIGARPVQIRVTETPSMDVWRNNGYWTPEEHPGGWAPEASFLVEYAQEAGLPLQIEQESLALTTLVWGGWESRVSALEAGYGGLNWPGVQAASLVLDWNGSDSGYFKLAFARPTNSAVGLAALYLAAAEMNGQPTATDAVVRSREFQDWLLPAVDAVPSFAALGQEPAKALARLGPSVGDAALTTEAEWLEAVDGQAGWDRMALRYPAYRLDFDFPLAVWTAGEESEQQAVAAFADFLMTSALQEAAMSWGLRPSPAAGTPVLWSRAGGDAPLQLPAAEPVTPPSRAAAIALTQWGEQVRREP